MNRQQKIKILCIDDEAHILNALKRSLRSNKFIVYTTTDLDSAYEIFTTEKPDVVISDFMMPGLNGAELMRELEFENPKVPWIFLSGYAKGEIANSLQESGRICAFVQKPWSQEGLLEAINKAVESKKEEEGEPSC